MDQWVKGPAVKSDSLNLIPRSHTVAEKNRFWQVVPRLPHTC